MATCVPCPICRGVPGGPLSYMERTGGSNIADSDDEVRLRVREQLLLGASQIKLVGGGGVSSPRTTLDMLTFSGAELRAARRSRRRPEHLRRRARLPAGGHRAGARRRGAVHRTRPSHGRPDGEADGRQRRLAQHPAVPQRRGHGRARRPKSNQRPSGVLRARTPSIRWRKSTGSRPRSDRTSSFRARWPRVRAGC